MIQRIILLMLLLIGTKGVNAQCAVNVSIQEGTAITMCANAPETIHAASGFVSYTWSGPESLSGQNITPSFSGTYQVDAVDGVGCVSSATITVTINPVPVDVISSSEGTTLCPGSSGTILSLNNAYVLYQWSTGEGTPTINVNQAGTYNVAAADNNGCVGIFSITINAVNFDLQVAQNGGCGSGSVALTASGGTGYLWSTGETSPGIVVSPANPTSYSVTITNGSCVQQLSAVAEVINTLPEYELVDTIYISQGEHEYIIGPTGFDSYLWSPSEFVSDTSAQDIYFLGDSTTTLFLQAISPDGCTIYDSVHVIVVNLTIPNGFSPNHDGINDVFEIPELYYLVGELTVFNRYGDIVYYSERYENNWSGKCEGNACMGEGLLPEGTYFYNVEVEGISFKGYLTIKRSI